MQIGKTLSQLDLFKDTSEIVHYNVPGFPVYTRSGLLSVFPDMEASCHWHDDIEFLMAQSGHMMYSVNGKNVLINEGEGILINSRQLHYGYSADKTDCTFFCVLFPPKLLCSNPYLEEMTRIITEHPGFDQILLRPEEAWGKTLLSLYYRIFDAVNSGEPGFELMAMSHVYSVCGHLYRLLPVTRLTVQPFAEKDLEAQKKMISFIHQSYPQKLSLQDIAYAGNVCRSKCCAIFRTYLNKTPVEFLTEYRLEQSLSLLASAQSITETALACGFSSSSYFTETFRQFKGCTPSEYRVRFKQ